MTLQQLFRVLGLMAVLGLVPALAACNTIAGAGEDISTAGEAVSGTAEETQEGL